MWGDQPPAMSFEDAKSFRNRPSAFRAKRLLQRPVHQPEPAFAATGPMGNGACRMRTPDGGPPSPSGCGFVSAGR